MKTASMQQLRKLGREARRRLTDEDRAVRSQRIQRRFLNSEFFYRASHIGCYIASPFEVDTSLVFDRAWRAGKKIYAPITGPNGNMHFMETLPGTRLVPNRYGLFEPESGEEISAHDLRIVIAPTVAFDEEKNRIGMGGGYYDRAFHTLKNRQRWLPTKLIGFAFDCQKVEKIPANPWDIPLYRLFSENETIL